MDDKKKYNYIPVERLVRNTDPETWEEQPEWEDLSEDIAFAIDTGDN